MNAALAEPGWLPALAPPRAHGTPLGRAALKLEPEDFVVEERLSFAADGGAGHVLLKVRKRDLDTLALTRALAHAGGVAARDVGFAGLKDRRALATQWLTVPARRPAAEWAGLAGEGFEVVEAHGHSRKLKRGALVGNAFRITLRGAAPPVAALAARLRAIGARGVPNYFGPQRFGRDGSNLLAIGRWRDDGRLPRGREGRAFVYSAARSLLFNAVLAKRVLDGSWERLLPGEFVNLAGRRSWFVAAAVDAELEARLARHDVHPTGPLTGVGPAPEGAAGALEAETLAEFAQLSERLGAAGLEAARRALRLLPTELRFRLAGDALTLEFALPAGGYATAVVRELVDTETLDAEGGDDRD